MRKQMKMVLGIFVFCLCLVPLSGVKAADYGDEIIPGMLGGTPKEFVAGDTFTAMGYNLIGEDGYINITEGKVTVAINGTSVTMTVDGTAETTHMKNLMFVTYNTQNMPINMVVTEGSTFNLKGNMALTTGTPTTFTNNGTVNIIGNLEVRSASTYTGTGTTNLYGNLSIYGDNGLQTNVNVFENANVYANSDVASKLAVGEANTDEYTYELGENDKKYNSISLDVTSDFAYGYTLTKTKVPAAEDVTATPEDTQKEEITNPKTADSILLITLALLASGSVAVVAGRKLVKQRM